MALRAFNHEEDCSCRRTPLPYVPYRPAKTDWTLELKEPVVFSIGGRRGVPLKPSAGEAAQVMDDADFQVYCGCGPKATLVIQPAGYRPLKVQKHAYSRRGGRKVAYSREKVVTQVASVMKEFMARGIRDGTSTDIVFGEGGIKLEDLVLLELRHVAKSSYQPIFGMRCTCPPILPATPSSPFDMWLQEGQSWDSAFDYNSALAITGPGYDISQPLQAADAVNIDDPDVLAMLALYMHVMNMTNY